MLMSFYTITLRLYIIKPKVYMIDCHVAKMYFLLGAFLLAKNPQRLFIAKANIGRLHLNS